MDFNWATERLAVGAAINSDADWKVLIDAGVTHIIDCQSEHDDMAIVSGITILWIGVADDGQPKPVDWFARGCEFALAALAVSPNNKVYAHCAAGINRGPSMAYAVLRSLGLPNSDAENLIRRARPQAVIAYKADADRAMYALGYDKPPFSSTADKMNGTSG